MPLSLQISLHHTSASAFLLFHYLLTFTFIQLHHVPAFTWFSLHYVAIQFYPTPLHDKIHNYQATYHPLRPWDWSEWENKQTINYFIMERWIKSSLVATPKTKIRVKKSKTKQKRLKIYRAPFLYFGISHHRTIVKNFISFFPLKRDGKMHAG